MKGKVLIVEDEGTALKSLSMLFADEDYEVLIASDGERGLALALQEEPDLVLIDIRLPGMDGLSLLERLRAGYSDAAVLVMTADSTATNAIRATQLGAFDYIVKPLDVDHLLLLTQRALDYRRLEQEVRHLRNGVNSAVLLFPALVGHSPAMQEIYKRVGRVAGTDATVLIYGESGTGKELVANALHDYSQRAKGPLVKVNCAAIPESLLEAELFGHERGAFTNAVQRRIGKFEEAHGGTLFLDEIAELSPALQAKLLRAVQERRIERLGSNQSLAVDFRLLAATAQDLGDAVSAGRFREDLFYRLNVVRIDMPPLRERREDIPLLVQRFLGRSDRLVSMRQDTLDRIQRYNWPGNVRELENVITRAIALSPGGVITPEAVEFPQPAVGEEDWLSHVPHRLGYKQVVRQVEARLIQAALADADGNKLKAAAILGIQRRLLYDKMREHGIAG